MSSVNIRILHCGTLSLAPSMVSGGKGTPLRWTKALLSPDCARAELPVTAYLVEDRHGLMLVDTGWCRRISPEGQFDMAALRQHIIPPLAMELRGRVAPGMTVREQLNELGIRPSDIDVVLLTNLDADHVSGLSELGGAKRVITAEEEVWWQYRTSIHHCTYLWEDFKPETFYYRGCATGPTGRAYDLWGDGSVMLIETPGHSKGTTAVRIRGGGGFVILASDSGYTESSWLNDILPSLAFNKTALLKTYGWLRAQAREPRCRGIYLSHDPAVKPGVIEL